MDHNAVVAQGPLRSAFHLLPDKPVLYGYQVVREFVFVEEMAKLPVQRIVLIVRD